MREPSGTGFLLLGTYKLPGETPIRVTLTTAGADGRVVADGVQFLPAP
jgi:hypothetical protein